MIVESHGTVFCCPNPFAQKAQSFGQSALLAHFRGRERVFDAFVEERAGRAYVADCAIPRKDERAVLKYVVEKYSLPLGTVNVVLREHTAAAVVRDHNDHTPIK
jgi:hypothetical protein